MRRTARAALILGILIGLMPLTARAADKDNPAWLLPMPEVDADPKVPTLKQAVGHGWAEEISSHSEIERYLRALTDAAPDRTRLLRYGETIEKRGLYLLVITSAKNIARLDEIRVGNLRLADPRKTTPEGQSVAGSIPGDRLDGIWSARRRDLLGRRRTTDGLSPPGRSATINSEHAREGRRHSSTRCRTPTAAIGSSIFIGRTAASPPDAEPLAAERVSDGQRRLNHYLFDMNRDWFLQTQVETRTRVAAYLRWQPHVTIDAHEMGPNSEYYFDPPADPILELITPKQREWFGRFGTRQGRRFDQFGFAYTTREVYDAFYPGYGSTWPTLHGSIGILWEQAGARGLVVDREDQRKLHYHDGVRHHYVSSISTVETAAAMASDLVKDFHEYRGSAITLGNDGPVRDYVLLAGATPARAARLAGTSGRQRHRGAARDGRRRP